MITQAWLRRPSNPIIIAISGAALLLFILFAAGSPRLTHSASFISKASSSSSLDDIRNTTLGFEKIFVVGLPSRTDRRDAMILSAALGNMEMEFIDGVLGQNVLDSAIPSPEGHPRKMANSSIGSWRGHMNAIQEIVRRNLTSAIIFEDDADWDVRLRDQLRDFALSSRTLIQPLSRRPSAYADHTYPKPQEQSQNVAPDIAFDNMPSTLPPHTSPYGDNWDILWIGHCGMKFPRPSTKNIPRGRVARIDPTVPQKRYLETVSIPDELKEEYPEHSRVVHHVLEGVCSLVYAISQAGARKLLYEVGIHHSLDAAYDILLRQFCEGTSGQRYHNCLAVVPSLFHHHRAVGPMSSESDISPHEGGLREKAKTPVVRWSQRMNWDALLDGRTDFQEQWPDQ